MLAGDGGFEVAGNTTLSLSAPISGPGNLVKSGVGTLHLTGANSYRDTFVREGGLIGDTISINGNIVNDGAVVFSQQADGTFVGNISGAGTMRKLGADTLTLTGSSTLDWSVDGGALVSSADRFSGNAAIGSNGTLIFDQAAAATYGGVLSGNGAFSAQGGGRLAITGDSSGFSGTAKVADGLLSVNGALGGTVTVVSGGVLGGSGTVGTTTISSGGSLAPGNSIGTLAIDGDLTFETGSSYIVEVDAHGTDADLVRVTGNATLHGGTAMHIGAAGTYDPSSRYRILSAGTGLKGSFDTVTSDFAFLTPDLVYEYGNGTIHLELTRNEIDFSSKAETRNQIATAGGIDSLGMGNAVYDAIVTLPDDGALIRGSFDQLSGEIHASAKTALIEESRFVRDAVMDRIRAAFGGVAVNAGPVIAYGEDGPKLAASTTDRFAAWGQTFGSWSTTDGDGNAASLDYATGGFLTGTDAPVFDTWRLGIMAGYSHTSFDAKDRVSSGDGNNYHVGVYGGSQWGPLGFRSGLAYTWHDIDTARSVAVGSFNDSLKGDYRGGTFQTFGELGYHIDTTTVSFEPFANLAYVNLDTRGFTERGAAAALHADGQNTDTPFTTLGIRASSGFTIASTTASARGMIGWRHAYGDVTPLSRQAFAGGDAFTIAGVPIARDAVVLESGLDFDLTGKAKLGAAYQGQFGSGARQDAFSVKLGVRF